MRQRATDPRPLREGGALGPAEAEAARLLEASAAADEGRPDRVAQERVWRQLSAELAAKARPATRWEWWPLLAAAAAGSAVVLLVIAFSPFLSPASAGRRLAQHRTPGTLQLAAGSVLTAAPRADWTAAHAGAPLPEATRLRTDARGRAVLGLGRAAVLAQPGTDLALDSLGGQTFLRLSGGELVAEVEHRQSGESFEIQTTRYRVAVRGTVFSVRERAPDDVEVSVARGRVEVSGEGGTWQVAAGERWQSRIPAARSPQDIAPDDRQLLGAANSVGPRSPIEISGADLAISVDGLSLGSTPVSWNAPLGPAHVRGQGTAGTAEADTVANADQVAHLTLTLARPTSGAAAEGKRAPPAVPSGSPVGSAVGSGLRSAPEETRRHQVPPQRAAAPAPSASVARAQPEPAPATLPVPSQAPTQTAPVLWARLDPPANAHQLGGADVRAQPTAHREPAPAAPTAAPRSPSAVVPTASSTEGSEFNLALTLSNQGRYGEAAAAFEALAERRGPHEAELALYELAQLRQKRLGDPAGALEALQRYERLYPQGTMVQEVEISAIELTLAGADPAAALSPIERFVRRHPESERLPEVELLHGNLLRSRGDCQAATEAYQRVQGAATLEDDSLFFQASCAEQLGHSDGARQLLQRYVARFPHGRHEAQVRTALGAP